MRVCFVALSVIFVSCISTRSFLINHMKGKGTVLNEYDEGENHYMIMKEGDRIVKYRLYDWSAGLQSGTQAEHVYVNDLNIEECFAGKTGETSIPYEKVKRDKDMKKYIK